MPKKITKSSEEWHSAHEEIQQVLEEMITEEGRNYRILMEGESTFIAPPKFAYPTKELIDRVYTGLKAVTSKKLVNELYYTVIPAYPKYLTLKDLQLIIEEHSAREMWVLHN